MKQWKTKVLAAAACAVVLNLAEGTAWALEVGRMDKPANSSPDVKTSPIRVPDIKPQLQGRTRMTSRKNASAFGCSLDRELWGLRALQLVGATAVRWPCSGSAAFTLPLRLSAWAQRSSRPSAGSWKSKRQPVCNRLHQEARRGAVTGPFSFVSASKQRKK